MTSNPGEQMNFEDLPIESKELEATSVPESAKREPVHYERDNCCMCSDGDVPCIYCARGQAFIQAHPETKKMNKNRKAA